MEKEIKELKERVAANEVMITSLIQRLEKLETGNLGTGVYFDGADEVVTDFVEKQKQERKGSE